VVDFAPVDLAPADASQMWANIWEQPIVAQRCLALPLPPMPDIEAIEQVCFAACGTSRHAALVARSWWSGLTQLPVLVEDAADGAPAALSPTSLLYLLSQSGQTRDVLKIAQRFPQLMRWGLTNGAQTQLHELADYTLQTPAGEEKAVAATKTFLAQLILLLRLALCWHDRLGLHHPQAIALRQNLAHLPQQIEATLRQVEQPCQQVAVRLNQANQMILLGSGINTAIALEGALKLKETVYIHAEGASSGNFMHGPIAIIDSGFPVVTIAIPSSENYAKTLLEAQRIKSYGAYLVGITTTDAVYDADLFDAVLPIVPVDEWLSPMLTVLPLQMLAYEMAKVRGLDIDAPRNLTKFIA
jgi:glucosamine 6-phosphate synthetase-like amidotransferase/phosphosugar isomerase protein